MEFDIERVRVFYDEFYAHCLKEKGNAFLMALAARDKYALPGDDYVMSNRTEMLAREYMDHDDFASFESKLLPP